MVGQIAAPAVAYSAAVADRRVNKLPLAVGAAIACRNRGNRSVSIAFGGPDLKTVHLGSLFGARMHALSLDETVQWIERRHNDTDSDWSREKYEGYMRDFPCPRCGGTRHKPEVLEVTIDGRNIAEVCALSVGECADLLGAMTLTARQKMIAERVLKEVNARLGFPTRIASVAAGVATIDGIEQQLIDRLGERGHRQLRRLLTKLLDKEGDS